MSRSRFERRFWSFSQRCDSPNLPDLSAFGQPEEPLAIELRIYGLWEKGICRTKVVFDEEGVQSMQPDLGLVAFVLALSAVHLRTNYQHRSSPMWPRRSN